MPPGGGGSLLRNQDRVLGKEEEAHQEVEVRPEAEVRMEAEDLEDRQDHLDLENLTKEAKDKEGGTTGNRTHHTLELMPTLYWTI